MTTSDLPTVLLDRRLAVSQAHVNHNAKLVLTAVIRQAIVKVHQDYFYRVDFGPGIKPMIHIVSHDLYCSCALEADCAAVTAVKVFLRDGGELAKVPPPGYFPSVPHACPVCGARAIYHSKLSSHRRGAGWICKTGGVSHYWQYEFTALQASFAEKWKKLGVDPTRFK